jgi:hypothetical protein
MRSKSTIFRCIYGCLKDAEVDLLEIQKEPLWKDAFIKQIASNNPYEIDDDIFIIKLDKRVYCSNRCFMRYEDLNI